MDFPNFLNIGIGLIFIYLILSLLASEIQEMTSSVLELRAKNLKEAIKTIISNSRFNHSTENNLTATNSTENNLTATNSTENNLVVDALYNHSLISALNHNSFIKPWKAKSVGPSYIPAEMFASALLEVLGLTESLNEKLNLDKFKKSIEQLGLKDEFKSNLIALASRAEENGTYLRQELEKWFDRSMERASGAYKRDAKVWAIFIGFFIALFANADSLHIVSRLSKEKTINTSLNSYVMEVQKECADKPPSCISMTLDDESLTELSLPIGWDFSNFYFIDLWHGLLKIIGWALTGIAISMGSSFWFDLLNKFINVRYAGRNPKEMNEKNDRN